MSDLKLSSGSGGTSDKALQAKGPKRTQEVTKEERVSFKTSSPGDVIVWNFYNPQLVLNNLMCLYQATELFMRAVYLEQNGSFYEGVFARFITTIFKEFF